MLRSAGFLVLGIVLGILTVFGGLQVAQAFGQGMRGPIASMMGQMMGPQGTAEMMGQMMRDPRFMQSMAAACAQNMKDPAVLQSMRDAMDDPQMRRMMEQMYDMMRRR